MVVFMSGGSRGIGRAIAERLARDGAKVALMAKTDEPHPKLPGTIHTAAAAIEDIGSRLVSPSPRGLASSADCAKPVAGASPRSIFRSIANLIFSEPPAATAIFSSST